MIGFGGELTTLVTGVSAGSQSRTATNFHLLDRIKRCLTVAPVTALAPLSAYVKALTHAGRTMTNSSSPVHGHIDIDHPTAEPHLVMRAADGVRRFFSVAIAACDAADQYQQLAKASPNDLIARGDLNRDVFKILVGRK